MKKIINVNIFKIFKKKSQKWPTQDLSNIERNKVMKNQPIRGIPRGLAYDNQPGGVFLTPPPYRIGLSAKILTFLKLKIFNCMVNPILHGGGTKSIPPD